MTSRHAALYAVRRYAGAILTLLFVVLTFAGPLRAQAESPQPAPAQAVTPAAPPAGPPPPMVAVEPLKDLGTLVRGDVRVHEFVLRNTGKEPLTIERTQGSCPCTKITYGGPIAPGGEDKLRVELDSSIINGTATVTVDIFVKGYETPVRVSLRVNVVGKLLAKPGQARWIFVQHEKEGTLGQTVYAADGADFKITAVQSPMPAITVTYREAKPEERVAGFGGSQWRVEPTLDSAAPVGAITGFVVVTTTHPLQKVIRIPVSGFVRPTLLITPERSDFGTLELSGRRHATYQVRNFATESIAVTGAETDIPGITAKLEPVEKGRRYNVVVVLDPAVMKEGPFSGKLRVTTESAKVPTLTVDLSGTLVRAATAEKQ